MVILKYLWDSVINFIFPQQCCICKSYLGMDGAVCANCLAKLDFISNPKCECCGLPFEFKLKNAKQKLLCPNCIKKPYKFDKAISSVKYNEFSKKIILPLKHGDKTQYAKFIANIMTMSGRDIATDSDFIIPVPIHLTRMLKRKYNQASLIANHLSKVYKKPVLYSTLIRSKSTPSQGHLSERERKQNVSGVFSVKHSERIKGKNILLIDDVFTTGATVNECAKILKKAGANKIFVLTFARAIK